MAHAQEPDFVFRRNGRVRLYRRGTPVQSTTGNRGVCISGSNAGYTMFRGSVKCTGYPLHSPVSPSLLLPCVTVCHHISTGLYPGGELSYLAPLGSENISAPYFKQCFFRGGRVLPPRQSNTTPPSPKTENNKYFILYIEFCINNKI